MRYSAPSQGAEGVGWVGTHPTKLGGQFGLRRLETCTAHPGVQIGSKGWIIGAAVGDDDIAGGVLVGGGVEACVNFGRLRISR